MWSKLQTYYPLYREWKKVLFRLIIMGSGIFWFLYCFQPFGIHKIIPAERTLFLLGFGLITFFVFTFFFSLLPYFFPNQINDWEWSLGKQLLLTTFALLTTFSFSYLYYRWYVDLPYSLASYGLFSISALGIALFPISIIVLMDKIYLLKTNFPTNL